MAIDIAQMINRIGGYDPECLMGCPRIEAGPMPPRAGNVTMNSSKLYGVLGCNPFKRWPLHLDELPTDRKWHVDRDPDETGSFSRVEELLYRYGRAPHP